MTSRSSDKCQHPYYSVESNAEQTAELISHAGSLTNAGIDDLQRDRIKGRHQRCTREITSLTVVGNQVLVSSEDSLPAGRVWGFRRLLSESLGFLSALFFFSVDDQLLYVEV